MSRSRKKHPITGATTAKSEKEDKRFANQKERQKVKSLLRKVLVSDSPIEESDTLIMPKKDEIVDVWQMEKDGRINWKGTEWEKKAYRK